MIDLDELLDAVPERKGDALHLETADVLFDGKVLRFRFTELPTRDWAGCTMASFPRPGVILDSQLSYNLTNAAELAAPINGVILDGEDVVPVSREQWEKFFARFDNQARQAITDAIFICNEQAYIARTESAKKASEGVSKRKPRSPSK